MIKPPMKEAEVSTETPDYDRSLFVRIYCPDGLEDKSQIRCTLTCSGQIFKTGILDSPEDEEVGNVGVFVWLWIVVCIAFGCGFVWLRSVV